MAAMAVTTTITALTVPMTARDINLCARTLVVGFNTALGPLKVRCRVIPPAAFPGPDLAMAETRFLPPPTSLSRAVKGPLSIGFVSHTYGI